MTIDHAEATARGFTEKYLLGELADTERDAYEEHFFGCAECAEDVQAGAAFIDGARPEVAPRPLPTPITARGPLGRLFWPMPMGAAAALVLGLGIASYQATVVVPELRRELRASDALQAAPSFFLSIARAEPQVVTVPAAGRRAAFTLSRSSERAYPYYRCAVRDASDRVVLSSVVPGPTAGDELQIVVPTSNLAPGAYALVLDGLDAADGPTAAASVARYPFTLQRGEK